MNRADATARAIGFAREHIADYVPDAEVTLSTTREQTCPALSAGRVRLVVTLTVIVDEPDAEAKS